METRKQRPILHTVSRVGTCRAFRDHRLRAGSGAGIGAGRSGRALTSAAGTGKILCYRARSSAP